MEQDNGRLLEDNFPVGLKVLAVDDDRTCLKILEALLRRCEYNVTTTTRAIVALTMLRENPQGFDLVICNVHMPEMDGFALLEHVDREMDLPVIMVSGNEEKEAVMKGVRDGACDYLLKPLRIQELKNIWQHVVRKNYRHLRRPSGAGAGAGRGVELNEKPAGDSKAMGMSSKMATASVNGDGKRLREGEGEGEEEEGEGSNGRTVSSQQRKRLVWPAELHDKFLDAVNELGVDKAHPKRILNLMIGENVTREQIASHLQKFRMSLKKVELDKNQQSNLQAGDSPTISIINSYSHSQMNYRKYQAGGAQGTLLLQPTHLLGTSNHLLTNPSENYERPQHIWRTMRSLSTSGTDGVLGQASMVTDAQQVPSNSASQVPQPPSECFCTGLPSSYDQPQNTTYGANGVLGQASMVTDASHVPSNSASRAPQPPSECFSTGLSSSYDEPQHPGQQSLANNASLQPSNLASQVLQQPSKYLSTGLRRNHAGTLDDLAHLLNTIKQRQRHTVPSKSYENSQHNPFGTNQVLGQSNQASNASFQPSNLTPQVPEQPQYNTISNNGVLGQQSQTSNASVQPSNLTFQVPPQSSSCSSTGLPSNYGVSVSGLTHSVGASNHHLGQTRKITNASPLPPNLTPQAMPQQSSNCLSTGHPISYVELEHTAFGTGGVLGQTNMGTNASPLQSNMTLQVMPQQPSKPSSTNHPSSYENLQFTKFFNRAVHGQTNQNTNALPLQSNMKSQGMPEHGQTNMVTNASPLQSNMTSQGMPQHGYTNMVTNASPLKSNMTSQVMPQQQSKPSSTIHPSSYENVQFNAFFNIGVHGLTSQITNAFPLQSNMKSQGMPQHGQTNMVTNSSLLQSNMTSQGIPEHGQTNMVTNASPLQSNMTSQGMPEHGQTNMVTNASPLQSNMTSQGMPEHGQTNMVANASPLQSNMTSQGMPQQPSNCFNINHPSSYEKLQCTAFCNSGVHGQTNMVTNAPPLQSNLAPQVAPQQPSNCFSTSYPSSHSGAMAHDLASIVQHTSTPMAASTTGSGSGTIQMTIPGYGDLGTLVKDFARSNIHHNNTRDLGENQSMHGFNHSSLQMDANGDLFGEENGAAAEYVDSLLIDGIEIKFEDFDDLEVAAEMACRRTACLLMRRRKNNDEGKVKKESFFSQFVTAISYKLANNTLPSSFVRPFAHLPCSSQVHGANRVTARMRHAVQCSLQMRC